MAAIIGSAGRLYIRLFGPIHVELNGSPIPPLRTGKGYLLVALLTLRANRDLSRLWLAGCLWPESSDNLALSNLRRALTDLRNALGSAACRIESPTSRSLLFRLSPNEADVLEFDAALTLGTPGALERAVAIYRAPLLEGCDEIWAAPEQEPRREAYLETLSRLGAIKSEAGAQSEAIGYYRIALSAEPMRESVCAKLMQVLNDNGDPAAAAETYRALRLTMRNTMNADPSPAVTALYRRILDGSAKRGPAAPTPHAPKLPAAAPADPRFGWIPNPLTALIGREDEAEAIHTSLLTSQLVTLVGPGGIGKTRLAIHVSTAQAACFDDGIWFVDLATVADPEMAPTAVAAAIGLSEANTRDPIDSLRTFSRSRSMMLILDNCEHLLSACAELAGALTSSSTGLRILATSRQPLGITGEIVRRVQPLAAPDDSVELPTANEIGHMVSRYAALQLFWQRAKAVQPTFSLSTAGLRAVIAICRRLDGIPLAIELAAARVRSLSVEQILLRLDDRFRLLVSGSRGAIRRQQTLLAAVDWSYDLLEPIERVMLRRLSVFRGDFALSSVESVCADPPGTCGAAESGPLEAWEALDILERLVDKSLVTAGDSADGELQYRMLDTMREYARMRLEEAGESCAAFDSHLTWCMSIAEQGDKAMRGPDSILWLGRLQQLHDNVRGALEWCGRHTDDPGIARRELILVAGLWRFWMSKGHLREGLKWLTHALEVTRPLEGSEDLKPMRIKALYGAGGMAWQLSDMPLATALMRETLPLVQEAGDRSMYAGVLNGLGIIAYGQDDNDTAIRYLEESVAILRELGELSGLAGPLNNLGYVLYRTGQYVEAQQCHIQALAAATQCANAESVSSARTGLGNIAKEEGNLPLARRYYEENLQTCRALDNKDTVAGTLNNLALICIRDREYDRASGLLREAMDIYEEIESSRGLVEAIVNLAVLAVSVQAPNRAVRLLGAVRSMHVARSIPVTHEGVKSAGSVEAEARKALSESQYEVCFEQGAAMSADQTLAYARLIESPLP